MNLRTGGITLAILPLAIVLLVAIPEALLQFNAIQSVTQAVSSDANSELARSVEAEVLDVASQARSTAHGDPGAQDAYVGALYSLRADLIHLRLLAESDPTTQRAVDAVTASVFSFQAATDAALAFVKRGHRADAQALLIGEAYSKLGQVLRHNVDAFEARAHEDELRELAALDRDWKFSLALLALAVACSVLTTLLLLRTTGKTVRAIFELVGKSDRYRRGEPLGPPSGASDEIGRLDKALHDLVAAQELRERQLKRYRLLADVTHDIILFIDRIDLTIVDANAAALAAYGYTLEHLIGRPTAILHAAEDPIDAETIALSDTPAGLSYEGMHQRSDGAIFPVEVHARTADVEGRLTIVKTIRDISERRRTAVQLARALEIEKSAEQLHQVVEAAPNAMILVDGDGRITLVNSAVERMFGYPRQELLGSSVDVVVPERFRGGHPRLREVYAAAPSTRPMGAGRDLFGLRKDGGEVPIEVGLNSITTPQGEFVLTSIIDISERRGADELRLANAGMAQHTAELEALNAQIELRERQLQHYRLLADVTQDMILFLDRTDMTIIEANAAALKTHGYERSELIGKTLQLLRADDLPIEPALLARADTSAGAVFERLHRRADGTVFPVEIYARGANVDGRHMLLVTARDITERRQAAAEVSLAQQRYHLLAGVTSDMILFVDRRDLTVIDANAAALAAYGYERHDFIGKPISILRSPDDPYDPEVLALADTPAGSAFEAMHRRSDGTLFPVEGHGHTVEVNGRLMIVTTIRDISERRHAAEQVSQALDQALEASRLKSEFVATMSHEIRTPMHGVIGMSELLCETPLSPIQREYANTVKESAQALLAVIDDILDFSRLEANKVDLETVAFDPIHVVAGAINLIRGAARDKGLTLRSEASPHLPAAVHGDPTRLRQVLINLVGNAVKFTPTGGVTVSTSVERDGPRWADLLFTVSDTGIGVAPEARDRLFDAFVQGDGSTTRRFGGSGLGLSICRRLVELMGGRIWLGEHDGPGSTFCFTVRVAHTSEVVEAAPLAPGALRVLVLDDDDGVLQTLAATLASWGMHGASADDIDDASEQLRDAAQRGAPFDAVLIDYVLPRSDGLAFAAELGSDPGYGNPARILMTAFDAVGRKEAALAAGCAAYLIKPVNLSELYDALATIARSSAAPVVAAPATTGPARILMAEDSALVRRVARFQLEDLAYPVDIVDDGEQAVAAVATGNYDLVLMDVQMPKMDGITATRLIREAERETGKHVVVIALTANVLEGDREKCIDAGMDDFLTKPLKLDALRGVLERWLPERV